MASSSHDGADDEYTAGLEALVWEDYDLVNESTN